MQINFFEIILVLGVLRISRKAFEFEKVTRLSLLIIPVYSLAMLGMAMTWTMRQVLLLALVAVVAGGIGYWQTTKIEVKDGTGVDKHGRPIVLLKKNSPYIIGWVLIFISGIAMHILLTGEVELTEVSRELFTEIRKDLFAWSTFGTQSEWYVWALSGISSFTFSAVVRWREKHINAAIACRQRH